jgi:hypothetical protein
MSMWDRDPREGERALSRVRGERAVRHGATSYRRYSIRQKVFAWAFIVATVAALVGLVVVSMTSGVFA